MVKDFSVMVTENWNKIVYEMAENKSISITCNGNESNAMQYKSLTGIVKNFKTLCTTSNKRVLAEFDLMNTNVIFH